MESRILQLEQEIEYLKVSLRETKEQLESERKEKLLVEKISNISNRSAIDLNIGNVSKNELQLLSEINSSAQLSEVLDIMGNEVESLCEFDGYLINLFDKKQEALFCKKLSLPPAFYGVEIMYQNYKFPLSDNDINCEALKQKKVLYASLNDLDGYSESTKIRFERWRMFELVIIPIIHGNKLIGSVMAFNQDRLLCRDKVELLAKRLDYFKTPIQNSIFLYDLQERENNIINLEKEREDFLKFIIQINELSSVELIYEIVLLEIIRFFSFDIASIFMLEDYGLVFKRSVVSNESYDEINDKWRDYYTNCIYEVSLSDGTPPTTSIQGSHMYIPDVMEILHLPMSEKDKNAVNILETPRTMLCVPIVEHGIPVGVIWLFSLNDKVSIPDQSIKMIELLCTFIGTELSNAELYTTISSQKKEIIDLNDRLQNKVAELNKHEENLKQIVDDRTYSISQAKLEAEEANQAKSEFLANMSHELRTPLNSMLILAKLFADNEEGNLTDQQIEYAKIIYEGGQNLLDLINDILDLSKVEAGQMDVFVEDIDISTIVDRMSRHMRHLASNKNLEYKAEILPDVPKTISSDFQRIEQILKNLLSNAFKFTNSGTVILKVHLPEDGYEFYNDNLINGEVVGFSVIDTGIGISEEKQRKVFNAFEQADGSTSRNYGGTGLGLSISREMSNFLGGEVRVISEEGVGSVFTLYLPMEVTFTNVHSGNFSEDNISNNSINNKDDVSENDCNFVSNNLENLGNESNKDESVCIKKCEEQGHTNLLNGSRLLIFDSDMRRAYLFSAWIRRNGGHVTMADCHDLALAKISDKVSYDAIMIAEIDDVIAICNSLKISDGFYKGAMIVFTGYKNSKEEDKILKDKNINYFSDFKDNICSDFERLLVAIKNIG